MLRDVVIFMDMLYSERFTVCPGVTGYLHGEEVRSGDKENPSCTDDSWDMPLSQFREEGIGEEIGKKD